MGKENMLNLSMFILRGVLGAIFILQGAQNLFGMFDGIGVEGTAKMLEGYGFANAQTLAIIWACAEFASGIFLVLGMMSRWAALAVASLTTIHLWKTNLAYGLLLQGGDMERNLLIIAACIPIILLGGGSWSVWDV